jgi:hypothetical protein
VRDDQIVVMRLPSNEELEKLEQEVQGDVQVKGWGNGVVEYRSTGFGPTSIPALRFGFEVFDV